jgi:hypothetical protein
VKGCLTRYVNIKLLGYLLKKCESYIYGALDVHILENIAVFFAKKYFLKTYLLLFGYKVQ